MHHRNAFPVGRRPAARSAGVVAALALLLLGSCGVEAGDDVSAATTPTTSSEGTAEGPDPSPDPGSDGPSSTTGDEGQGNDPGQGDDDDRDDEGADTTSPDGETSGGEDAMVRDALIEGLESAGLTNEQATCLADGYIDLGITDPETAGSELDVMAMMEMFTQCGISMEDLGDLGAGLST